MTSGPCLLINRRQDAIAGYSDTLNSIDRFPRGTFAIIDCAGHSLSWERPRVFAALLQDWLDRMAVTQVEAGGKP